jgi:uncharacterized protein YbjT (DUF2867 family)
MTILVTGATGTVGRQVVGRLVQAGQQVRAVTRNPKAAGLPAGVQLVEGDLLHPDTVAPAFQGVDKLYLFPVAATAQETVDLAVRAGVRRIVVLSSGAVEAGMDAEFHLPVERAVEQSGLEWTHVRPGEFSANKLAMWGPSIRAESVVHEPFPDNPGTPIHEADIAAVAVTALLEDGHAGKAYHISGPEKLTQREQVAAIAEAIGREIRYNVVTREEALRFYQVQGGWAAANAPFLLGFEPYSEEAEPDFTMEELVDMMQPVPGVEEATGRPARTFAQWARDHAGDFR